MYMFRNAVNKLSVCRSSGEGREEGYQETEALLAPVTHPFQRPVGVFIFLIHILRIIIFKFGMCLYLCPCWLEDHIWYMIYQDSHTLLALVTSFHPTLSSRPFSLFILLSHISWNLFTRYVFISLCLLIGWSYAHLKIGKLVIRMIGDDVLCDIQRCCCCGWRGWCWGWRWWCM